MAVARDQSVKFLLDTNVISEVRKRDRPDAKLSDQSPNRHRYS
jgi:predicted nucleic acid-binding protein